MNDDPSRARGGWPAWEYQAERILSDIRAHLFYDPNAVGIVALAQTGVYRGDDASCVAFHNFLRISDAFFSRLIYWAEHEELGELSKWAGQALMERLRFLSSQEQEWSRRNKAFADAQKRFGDLRTARTPRSYLGWLASDYVRVINRERRVAALRLSPDLTGEGVSAADLLGDSEEQKAWLRKLAALEEFSPDSAPVWAEIVYERILMDEEVILAAPEMRGRRSRDADRRTLSREFAWVVDARRRSYGRHGPTSRRDAGKDAQVRLADFKSTITRAVITLAEKPRGGVRGVTRP